MRWVSTRVLPEPAPATMSSGPPWCSTASRCCGLSPSTSESGSSGARVGASGAKCSGSSGASPGTHESSSAADRPTGPSRGSAAAGSWRGPGRGRLSKSVVIALSLDRPPDVPALALRRPLRREQSHDPRRRGDERAAELDEDRQSGRLERHHRRAPRGAPLPPAGVLREEDGEGKPDEQPDERDDEEPDDPAEPAPPQRRVRYVGL